MSSDLFERAKRVIPGGVNSPVRAFNAVGTLPRFIASADGAYITDAEGIRYLDYVGSWGPMILGHNHPEIREAVVRAVKDGLSFGAATALEVEMAELITAMVPNLDMVRMVNSGTEAVMSALRLARGFTHRDKLIKFAGCYHGHADSMLVKAGSGALTGGSPDSGGVTSAAAKDTLIAPFNDLDAVEELLCNNRDEVAAVIVEPVAANMGVVPPHDGFLNGLRALCDAHGSLLLFDEVITGFRLAPGGAQQFYGVSPDLAVFGKIIGGGLPVGAYGGRRDIMSKVAPLGDVYQAGTLSGNPIALSAGFTALSLLYRNPNIYLHIDKLASLLADGLSRIFDYTVNRVGSLLCLFMNSAPVTNLDSASLSDTAAYASYFRHMLDAGIYLAPSQFEAMFISAAHTEDDIRRTLEIAGKWRSF